MIWILDSVSASESSKYRMGYRLNRMTMPRLTSKKDGGAILACMPISKFGFRHTSVWFDDGHQCQLQTQYVITWHNMPHAQNFGQWQLRNGGPYLICIYDNDTSEDLEICAPFQT